MKLVENCRFIPEMEMRLGHLGINYVGGKGKYSNKDKNLWVNANADGTYTVHTSFKNTHNSKNEYWYNFTKDTIMEFNKVIMLMCEVCRVIGEFERR